MSDLNGLLSEDETTRRPARLGELNLDDFLVAV